MSWSKLPARERTRLRALVLARDGHRCRLELQGCTVIATQADHIAPREVAGDGLDNLRAACAWCNNKRGAPGRTDLEPNVDRWW